MSNVTHINARLDIASKNEAPIPYYTVDLLFAAKAVLAQDNDDIELLVSNLEKAIISFEKKMPVKDGNICIQGEIL